MRTPLVCILLLLLSCATFARADEWRLWNSYDVKFPLIKDKIYWDTYLETRWGDDVSRLDNYRFYLGPEFKVNKWLDVATKYGIVEKWSDEWNTEHRFMLYATPKCKLSYFGVDKFGLGDLSIKLGNRLAWRITHYADHTYTWRYRFFPTISYPLIKTEKLTLSPYVSNYFYFNLANGIEYQYNRTYAGVSLKLLKHVALKFYYMRLYTKSAGEWIPSNVVGTSVGYAF